MKAYKIFRWFLRASALTTVMFVMQACYGSPNMPPERLDETDQVVENDTMVSADLQLEEVDSPAGNGE